MLKRIMIFVVLVGLLLMALPASFAQEGDATVNTDVLNVRAVPGLNAQIVGQYSRGQALTIAGREDQDGNGGIWVLATPVGGGTSGWVLSGYLRFRSGLIVEALPVVGADAQPAAATGGNTAPAAAAGSLNATVRSAANIRSGPGTTFGRLGGVRAGASATLTGRNGDGTWLFGVIGGREGWIFASLVRVSGQVSSLPVVAGATTTAATPAPATGGSNPVPVVSNTPIGGFSYGAHVANFDRPDVMQRAGMTWAKVQVRYAQGDDPNAQAGLINTAHAQGFRILLGVVGYPNDVLGGEAYFNNFAGYAAGLARLGADAIEVWNEPNLDREWATGNISASSYTRLLALSYNAIKAANPGVMVISGAPAPTGFFGGCAPAGCDDGVFISGMAAAGAANYMDCMGAHYNEGIVSPAATSGDPRGNFYTRYFWGMVNTYYNAIRKPICFTELGYVTPDGYGPMPPAFAWGNDTTLAEHAAWNAEAVAQAAGSGGKVRMVIIWNLNFAANPSSPDPAGAYAIIRPDGSCPTCDILASRR